MYKLLYYGNSFLRTTAKEVKDFDTVLKDFSELMVSILQQTGAVGLASTQINDDRRIIVVKNDDSQDPFIFVNPSITMLSKETNRMEEGCLSFPGIRFVLERPSTISLSAFDTNGNSIVMNDIEGILARIIQHEVDHLDGLLFSDRLSVGQKSLINNKLKKLSKFYGNPKMQTENGD
jgi:peptide deformylase